MRRGAVTSIDSAQRGALPAWCGSSTGSRDSRCRTTPAKVAFFGQPVAVVVGRTLEETSTPASLVTVRYALAAQVADIDSAQATPVPASIKIDYARGNPDAAMATAQTVSDLDFTITRYNHNPMELPSTVASWDGDQLTVWDKAQGINAAQEAYGHALGIHPTTCG